MRVIRIAQAQRLRRDRPSSYVVLKGEPPLGQPLYIYPGVPLIACVQATKDGIHNSMLLEVQSYTNETVTLKDCEGEGVYTLSHEWVRKYEKRAMLHNSFGTRPYDFGGNRNLGFGAPKV